MNQAANYKGRCFCGAVQFTVTGEPELEAYCHCDSCRHWSAGPVNALTLWSPDGFIRIYSKRDLLESIQFFLD